MVRPRGRCVEEWGLGQQGTEPAGEQSTLEAFVTFVHPTLMPLSSALPSGSLKAGSPESKSVFLVLCCEPQTVPISSTSPALSLLTPGSSVDIPVPDSSCRQVLRAVLPASGFLHSVLAFLPIVAPASDLTPF